MDFLLRVQQLPLILRDEIYGSMVRVKFRGINKSWASIWWGQSSRVYPYTLFVLAEGRDKPSSLLESNGNSSTGAWRVVADRTSSRRSTMKKQDISAR